MSTRPTRLSEDAIAEQLASLTGWERDGDAIVRAWTFSDFEEAFAFLTRVAIITEKLDHHAEIWNVYNQVKLTFSTHDADGLTHKDFDAATRINAIAGGDA
ncbi:MAG: 4a-hydroxytetrahydrobiopterin dehydratase [Myxococcales bacterium]|nr:4a-hydroxytetrahydrobiopterin dehydratase [Myxococcales bacterium]